MASAVTLVVPCFNEETRLPVPTFERFAAAHPDTRFVFVDDGSTDGTAALLSTMQTANRHIVLELGKNRGEAVRQGILRALADHPQFVAYWDADLATPLEVLFDFLAVLEESPDLDLVMGSRVPLLGRSVMRNKRRQFGGRMFAAAAALVLGVGVYDTQCGAKLFRVSAHTAAIFNRPFCSRWAFDVELLARLLASRGGPRSGSRHLHEFPLPEWSDVEGSKMRPWHMVQALIDLFHISLKNRRFGAPSPS
jgi:dolichyl-phosphate beta-glucosyltransferase